jgi:hypothetical protein
MSILTTEEACGAGLRPHQELPAVGAERAIEFEDGLDRAAIEERHFAEVHLHVPRARDHAAQEGPAKQLHGCYVDLSRAAQAGVAALGRCLDAKIRGKRLTAAHVTLTRVD